MVGATRRFITRPLRQACTGQRAHFAIIAIVLLSICIYVAENLFRLLKYSHTTGSMLIFGNHFAGYPHFCGKHPPLCTEIPENEAGRIILTDEKYFCNIALQL